MSAEPAAIDFRIELPIGPDWQNVDRLRLAILNCLAAVFGDQDLSESVGIVTSELLENAIKYGDWENCDQPLLVLGVKGNAESIRVDVASPIEPASPHFENVKRTIAWIERFPTARDAYVARMQAIAENGEAAGVSRMGLVRIAYEGPCVIEATVGGERVLHVCAEIPAVGRG